MKIDPTKKYIDAVVEFIRAVGPNFIDDGELNITIPKANPPPPPNPPGGGSAPEKPTPKQIPSP